MHERDNKPVTAYASSPDGQRLYHLASFIAAAKNPQIHFDLINTPQEELEKEIEAAETEMENLLGDQPDNPPIPEEMINPEHVIYQYHFEKMDQEAQNELGVFYDFINDGLVINEDTEDPEDLYFSLRDLLLFYNNNLGLKD